MYRDITFADKNPLKRWLQKQRLSTALRVSRDALSNASAICDYGAGDGELCKHIAVLAPHARILCFEPSPDLMNQARQNLEGVDKVSFCTESQQLPMNSVDVAFCLEVFEHLPCAETRDAIARLSVTLKPNGLLIVGVPVEVGVAALYKGAFRLFRRAGDFDANWRNIAAAALGSPPTERPVREIAPSLNYYPHHMGFDYRTFVEQLQGSDLMLESRSFSPFNVPGSLMPEAYFLLRKL